jgi:tetratricopeptide (TPR) repeat protein
VHYLYGDGLARNEKFDQALKELTEAIKQDEKFCLALNSRGAVYDIKGDLDKASDDFETVATLCPRFADVYASIGVVYLQRGFRGADAQFAKAIELDSTHALAYNGQACQYTSSGEIDKAQQAIIQANGYLEGNPFIVANARTFADSTDSTSTLGRIAHAKLDSLARGTLMGIWNFVMPDKFKAELKFTKLGVVPSVGFEWDLKATHFSDASIKSAGGLRGGVYFDIKEGRNLEAVDVDAKRAVSTEFTLGYPRTLRQTSNK